MNPQKKQLVDLASDVQLFRTSDGKLYGTVAVNGHLENWELSSDEFTNLLKFRYYRATEDVPNRQAVEEAVGLLQAKAQFEGGEEEVHVRVGEHNGRTYLDLGNDNWEAVEIDPNGWRVVAKPPLKFRRPRGMQALPTPVPGGSLDELRGFVNVATEDDWKLLLGWAISALRARGPYWILNQRAEHGSGKTTVARLLVGLIDPRTVEIRAEPNNTQDLFIAAANTRVLVFDNLSRIPVWLSDGLCQLSTGGGYSTRQLRSDADEALFQVQRPVILTGIGELATRGDLLDRCITLELPPISPRQRRPESEFWADYFEARPRILGALLEVAAGAIRQLPTTRPPALPRMADAASFVSAAEPSLGWPEGAFLQVYATNQAVASEVALDASPITKPLFTLLTARSAFQGTAEGLLRALNEIAEEVIQKQRSWPKNPLALSNALRRLAPNLRAAGVDVEFRRLTDRRRTRCIDLRFSASAASAPSALPEPMSVAPPRGMGIMRGSSDTGVEPIANETTANGTDSEYKEIVGRLREIISEAKDGGDLRTAIFGLREWNRNLQQRLKITPRNGQDSTWQATLSDLTDEQIEQLAQQELQYRRGPGGDTN